MGTQLRYIGPFEAVEVPAAGAVVERLKWVEMDTEIARSLLEQEDNWERKPPSTTKKEGD